MMELCNESIDSLNPSDNNREIDEIEVNTKLDDSYKKIVVVRRQTLRWSWYFL